MVKYLGLSQKVTKHSHGMTIYPVEKWVVGGILLGEYKPDQLREHMKNISPENCVAFLSSQSFESKYSFNLEKYTGRYPQTKLPAIGQVSNLTGAGLWIPDKRIEIQSGRSGRSFHSE